jgi:hypothetical protein
VNSKLGVVGINITIPAIAVPPELMGIYLINPLISRLDEPLLMRHRDTYYQLPHKPYETIHQKDL